jgi:hypothetical protein
VVCNKHNKKFIILHMIMAGYIVLLSNNRFQTNWKILFPMISFLIAVYCCFTVSVDTNGLGKNHWEDATGCHSLKKDPSQTWHDNYDPPPTNWNMLFPMMQVLYCHVVDIGIPCWLLPFPVFSSWDLFQS